MENLGGANLQQSSSSKVAMRVTKYIKQEKGLLRPSTLLPSKGMHASPVPAFQHGAEGDIYIFRTQRGWFFKYDKGTSITLNIPVSIRNNLEKVFAENNSGTPEDDRKFGCILMSLANLCGLNELEEEIVNQLNGAESMAEVFEISNSLKEKNTTYADHYNYWNSYIRSIDEGQEKVDEMAFRWANDKQFESSKHDIAQYIDWNQLSKDTIKQTVLGIIDNNDIKDSGHLKRKLNSKSNEELIMYVLVGKIHNFLQNELARVNSNKDEFNEKQNLAKIHERLDTLRSKIPKESQMHFDEIRGQFNKLDDKRRLFY